MRKTGAFLKRITIFVFAYIFLAMSNIAVFGIDNQSAAYEWGNVFLGANGFVTGMAVDSTGSEVYARTDVGGLYKYDNESGRWTQLFNSLGKSNRGLMQVRSVAIDPNNSDTVYAACGNGTVDDILKSTDGGKTWTFLRFKEKTNGGCFKGNGTTARVTGELLAIDPKNTEVIYAGTTGNGVFVTDDGGNSWTKIEEIPETSDMNLGNASNSGAISFVYIANSETINGRSAEVYVGSFGNGIYKSIDGGQNFTLITDGYTGNRNNGNLSVPCRVQKVGTKLYASSYKLGEAAMGGFFVYENGEWTDISPSGNLYGAAGFNAFLIDKNNAENILLASAPWSGTHKIWSSVNGGTSWTLRGEPGDVSALVRDPRNDNGIYAPYGAGIRYINNCNDLFSAEYTGNIKYASADSGIEELVCSKVVSVPKAEGEDSPEVLIQCWDHGMMKVENYSSGEKAEVSKPRFHYGGGIDYCEENPAYMLRCGQIGSAESGMATVAISDDYGNTFTDKSWDNWNDEWNSSTNSWTAKNEPENCSVTQTSDPSRVGWNPNLRVVDCAVGASYIQGKDYPVIMIHSVGHRSVQNPEINSGYKRGNGSGIYYSHDNGTTWTKTDVKVERCSSGSYYNNISLAADRVDGNTFYYVNSKIDVDRTWLEVTRDGGVTWTKLHEGAASRSIFTQYSTVKALPYRQGALWIKGKNGVIYTSYDYGNTLEALETISNVESFGFGIGEESGTPTAYAVGEVNGSYGVYMSVNLGERWIKIGPEGTPTNSAIDVCGDNNVFGRVYVASGGMGTLCGDGAPITEKNSDYAPGDRLKITAVIDNTLADSESAVIMAAFYDLNGQLVDVSDGEYVVEPGKREQRLTFEVTVPNYDFATVMKAFIVDDKSSLIPLHDSVRLVGCAY